MGSTGTVLATVLTVVKSVICISSLLRDTTFRCPVVGVGESNPERGQPLTLLFHAARRCRFGNGFSKIHKKLWTLRACFCVAHRRIEVRLGGTKMKLSLA